MIRPSAVVDIDNTIADTQTSILEYLQDAGVDISALKDYPNEFRDDLSESFSSHIADFIYSTDYENTLLKIPLFNGVLDALRQLSEACDIYIVSSRINNWHSPTMAWLDSEMITPLVKAVYLRQENEPSLLFKKRIIQELNATIIFEDSHEIVASLPEGLTVYLIDQPWNSEADPNQKEYLRMDNFSKAVANLCSRLDELHRQ